MSTQSPSPSHSSNFLLHYWRGEGALWKIFWLYGVLASAILAGLYALAFFKGDGTAEQILLPVLLVYTVWIVVSVWRSAPNVASEFYCHLARWLTVAWALNVLFGVIALQMGLFADYIGAAG